MTSKADQKRHAAYTRAAVRQQMEESYGDPVIDYYLSDDETGPSFQIQHPMFQDPETQKAMQEVQNDDNAGDHEMAQVLLGDRYDEFIDAGGTDQEIGHLMIIIGQDMQARSASSRPTKR